MLNGEILSSESVSITADAYLEGLQMKYDFYTNTIGFIFLVAVGIFIFYILTRHN